VAEAVIDGVFAWFGRVDELFSTWRDDSEIVRIAQGTLAIAVSSPETRAVLALCHRLSSATGGAFDIAATALLPPPHGPGWCPLDPSAAVKGWALDRAAGMLQQRGIVDFTINAGGDIITRGRPHPADEWRIGIQHPWTRDKVAAVVAGNDLAIATSGRYERGEHILDPKTGQPPTGLTAVTVLTEDLAHADGYATAAIALGHNGMAWLASLDHLDAMGITDSGDLILTQDFGRHRRP